MKTLHLDPIRTARQVGIVDLWQANNGIGTILAVTGFGKTRTMLLGAERLCNSPNAKVQRTVTVIVPTLQLKEDWEAQLANYSFPSRVLTIQSLTRRYNENKKLNTSLLILDEIHRYNSEIFGKVFNIVNYSFVFGGTATIDQSDAKFDLMKKYAPIIDQVTLEEAKKHNWVSDFVIYNLGIRMTLEEQRNYAKIGRKMNTYFPTFNGDFELAMMCISDANARALHAKQIGWDEGAVLTHAVQLSRTIQERRKFLYELPSKITIAKEIIDRFPDRIFITFSQSTDFADDLAIEIGDEAVAFHSNMRTQVYSKTTGKLLAVATKVKNKTLYRDVMIDDHSWLGKEFLTWQELKDRYPLVKMTKKGDKTRRKEALKRFKDGRTKTRVISTAKALDEGFNVPDIDASIVCSGTSVARQSIQRLGRMIRQQEGKTAFQVELYVKDTQEEVWLRKRQKESTNIQWINSINDIAVI